MLIMQNHRLNAACREIAYSKSKELNDIVFEKSMEQFKDLCSNYGYWAVLGELSTFWQYEKAVPFFEKIDFGEKKRKKIRTIATSYHKCYNGGVERVQSQLINLWVDMGYQVILITDEAPNILDYSYSDLVKRIVMPAYNSCSERLAALYKIVTDENVDIFINHDWGSSYVLWECMLMKFLHVSYVLYTHGHFAWNYVYGRNVCYTPRIYKMCDLILSLSETNARYYQLCGCKSFLVQNPVPNDLLQIRTNYDSDTKHILFIGRLSKEKRPMDAIRIFKLVHEQISDAILDVVGEDEGDYIRQMNDYIKDNNLSDAVIFHGLKSQEEVELLYKKASVLLFTSEMEGYPMVLLESKAYGIPCIMYDLSYLSLVKDRKGVIIAPIGDIQTMADSVKRLMLDRNLRIRYSNEAKESFRDFCEYNLESVWDQIIKLVSCDYYDDRKGIHAYFDPTNVDNEDTFIMPMLLNAILKGYEREITKTKEYKIGYKFLRFPRYIKKKLHRLRELR